MKAEHRKHMLAQLRLLRKCRHEIEHMQGLIYGIVTGLEIAEAITWEEAERLRDLVSNAAEWARLASRSGAT